MKEKKEKYSYIGILLLIAIVLKELLSTTADLLSVQNAFESYFPLLADIPDLIWQILLGILSLVIVLAAARYYYRCRKRDLRLVEEWEPACGQFRDDDDLEMRYVRSEPEIEELAKTEDYGSTGETNIPQVLDWWRTYPYGNVVAIYRNKVIGGMDIWPIKKSFYTDMISGHLGEENLTGKEMAVHSRRRKSSYWYIGSISLAQVWKGSKARKELLLRLVVNALSFWRSREPVYPATFVALAWTRQGMNLLRRNKFISIVKPVNALNKEPCFTMTVENEAEIDELIDQLKGRLSE